MRKFNSIEGGFGALVVFWELRTENFSLPPPPCMLGKSDVSHWRPEIYETLAWQSLQGVPLRYAQACGSEEGGLFQRLTARV